MRQIRQYPSGVVHPPFVEVLFVNKRVLQNDIRHVGHGYAIPFGYAVELADQMMLDLWLVHIVSPSFNTLRATKLSWHFYSPQ